MRKRTGSDGDKTNGRRPPAPRKRHPLSSDYAVDRDVVDELEDFENTAKREEMCLSFLESRVSPVAHTVLATSPPSTAVASITANHQAWPATCCAPNTKASGRCGIGEPPPAVSGRTGRSTKKSSPMKAIRNARRTSMIGKSLRRLILRYSA